MRMSKKIAWRHIVDNYGKGHTHIWSHPNSNLYDFRFKTGSNKSILTLRASSLDDKFPNFCSTYE